jgi:glycolate dehydrogenase FAD-binding subunit
VVVDGLEPARVERPASAEQLADLLCTAAAAGEAVIPIGGGRALGLGDPPERFDVALETGGLNRVLELSQADLTVSVEAGVTLETLNGELEKGGQFLPVDPFNGPGHTVGGLLAAALSGPRRLRYGSPRDFTIGLRVALPDGHLASSGGRVVKNVSGYDLNKLHQGALGSLGVIVAASFKVFPRPLHQATVGAAAEDLDRAWAEARRALTLPLPPTALELVPSDDGGHRLHARFEGSRKGVERTVSELGWQASDEGFWTTHATRGSDAWARISVPPGSLLELVRGIPGQRWWCSPGVGVAHWLDARDPGQVSSLRTAAERRGGSLVLLAAPLGLKRQVGAWGTPPATLEWMRRLKDTFDPGRSLSPGRFLV